MAGKDMPSLEVRAGRGGRPPLSSRDRELGCDGSSGAILLTKRLSCKRGALFLYSGGVPAAVRFVSERPSPGTATLHLACCGVRLQRIQEALKHDSAFGT